MSLTEGFDIKNSCRTCTKTGCPLRSIYEVAFDDTTFAKIIESISISTQNADELSEKICFKCQESAIIYWQFPRSVLQAETNVLSMIQRQVPTSVESLSDASREYEFALNDSLQDESEYTSIMGAFDEFEELTSPAIEIFCDICGSLQNDEHELEDHLHLHSKATVVFMCKDCNQEFTSPEQLDRHLTEDCNVKSFESVNIRNYPKEIRQSSDDNEGSICNICGKAFKSKDNLSRHVTRHSNAKDFKCIYCPREYYFQRDLNVHLKQRHFETKKFLCNICDGNFTTTTAMKKHIMIMHSKVARKFDCDKCQLSFKMKGTLIVHQRTHTKEKPFKCQLCLSAFKQKAVLQRHMKSLHNENIYECKWCSLKFAKHGELRQHWSECSDLRNRCDYEEVFVSNAGMQMIEENEIAVHNIED